MGNGEKYFNNELGGFADMQVIGGLEKGTYVLFWILCQP